MEPLAARGTSQAGSANNKQTAEEMSAQEIRAGHLSYLQLVCACKSRGKKTMGDEKGGHVRTMFFITPVSSHGMPKHNSL
jgi:hypothetical protein